MKTGNKISGIILTGGKSTRLGNDKGFLEFNNKYFIEIAIGIISEICDEILISANNERYGNFGYKTIGDEIPGAGPIGGIYGCLKNSSYEHNIIIPVDMPFVIKEVYEYLLIRKDKYKHIVALNNNDLPEPMIAYYNKSMLKVLKELIDNKSYKMQDIAGSVTTKFVRFDDSLDFYNENLFYNVNTISDFNKLHCLIQ